MALGVKKKMSIGAKNIGVLLKASGVLLVVASDMYAFGLFQAYNANCKPTDGSLLALVGLSVLLVAIGVGLGYALLKKHPLAWVGVILGAIMFAIMGYLLFALLVVRCSGV